MPEAGWYPDPDGTPGRGRYFDGAGWTNDVRPLVDVAGGADMHPAPTAGAGEHREFSTPSVGAEAGPGFSAPTAGAASGPDFSAPSPSAPQPHAGPEPQPPAAPMAASRPARRAPLLVGAAVGLAALVGATSLVWWPRGAGGGGSTQPTTPSASATPSATPPARQRSSEPAGTFTCFGGSVAYSSRQPAYTSYGLVVEAPNDWGVRFDKTQWTWLHEAALWGKNLKDPTGIALGGVQRDAGFTWDNALERYQTCLRSPGVLEGASVREVGRGATTLAGAPAQQVTFVASGGGQETWHRLYVVDTGTYGGYATLLEFAPNNPAAIAEVQRVTDATKAG